MSTYIGGNVDDDSSPDEEEDNFQMPIDSSFDNSMLASNNNNKQQHMDILKCENEVKELFFRFFPTHIGTSTLFTMTFSKIK